MRKLLLVLVCLFVAASSWSQVMPITGGPSSNNLCLGTNYTLYDVDTASGGTWSSSNTAVAVIGTNGVVTPRSAGVVTISLTVYPVYATRTFTVNALPGAVTISSSTLCIGDSTFATDTSSFGVWTSNALGVARIGTSSGKLFGTGAGTATISYTIVSTGCVSTGQVTVNSVAISGPTVACIGSTGITLTDALAGGIWSSSNTAVATIGSTSGYITAIAPGFVTMTYNDGTGCTASKLVSIKSVPSVSPSPLTACVGSNTNVTGSPAGGSWASVNPAIATINYDGVATGVAAGSTYIDYIAPGGCSTEVPIIVSPVPGPISGATFVYSGNTITLIDGTIGGTWSSTNPAFATVNTLGVVTGVAAGLLDISYTLPTGCGVGYRIEVNPFPAFTDAVAWYPFCNGDTADYASSHTHTMIKHYATTTTPVTTTDIFLVPTNAYLFDGTQDMMYVNRYFPASPNAGQFTYSCRVNVDPTVMQNGIIWYNGDPIANGFGLVINGGGIGTPGNQIGVLFGGVAQYFNVTATAGWHTFMLEQNGASYQLYLDGASVGFFIDHFNPMLAGTVFQVGYNYEFAAGYVGETALPLNGSVDDIAIFDRILSSDERRSLLNYNPDAAPFSLGNDTTICSDFMSLSPNPQSFGANYMWETISPFFGVTQIDSTDTTLVIYPNAGSNTYGLSISKPHGCASFDTIVVTKSPVPVTLGPDQKLCIGDTVTLTDFFPRSSFLWSTGDTSHSIKVTTNGTYYVTVDSTYYFTTPSGALDSSICVGRDTVNVNFYAIPITDLPTAVANCLGQPYTLTEFYDTSYTYRWIDGSTADSFIAVTSGIYWVRVIDTGCVRTDTINVTIVYDTLSFLIGNQQICLGNSVSTVGFVTNNFVASYQWTPTTGIPNPNVFDPIITPDTSATYALTVSYPGCPNLVDSFHIDVQPNPTVILGTNRDVCQGDTMHLSPQITIGNWYSNYTYTWSPSTYLNSATGSTVIYTAGDSTKMVVSVTTPAGCYGADSIFIFVHPTYFDSMSVSYFSMCPGDSAQFLPLDTIPLTSGNIVFNHWSPGTYLTDSSIANPWIHPINSQNYRYIATSQYGCNDTMQVTVVVNPAAVINLGDSVAVYPGASYHIQPQTNCTYFTWYPPIGLNDTNVADPIATPDAHSVYHVHGTTEAGCATDDSIILYIDKQNIVAVPNAFAPGSGANSKFMLIQRGVVTLNYFRIFDRWGNMVYESTNINDGWDGTYKGVNQPFGVYVYEFEALSSVTGQLFHQQGNVTLIR
jgi:gliding motility-associated-like protein